MLFLVTFLGVVGAFVFGLVGLARGDAGELERILGIACIAMAAAGLVGRWARSPVATDRAHVEPRRVAISLGDLVSIVAAAPVVALAVGVFLLTLVPSIYVSIPVFAIWWLGRSETRRPRHVETIDTVEPIEPVAVPAPLPEPAVV